MRRLIKWLDWLLGYWETWAVILALLVAATMDMFVIAITGHSMWWR